jgi:hypothetical protein
VLLFVSVVVGVAFQTLLEWRFLGYIHIHKGPNKAGFRILQQFEYTIKLLSREHYFHLVSNYLLLFSNFLLVSFVVGLVLESLFERVCFFWVGLFFCLVIDWVFMLLWLLDGLLILCILRWRVCVLWLKLFLMRLDWLLFYFLLLFWSVEIIWLVF